MEKENIEKIMEEYRSEMQKLENSNQEKKFETNKKKLHIERLEEEMKDVDPISEKSLYEEYKKQINDAKRELEDFIKETRTPDEIYNEKKEKEIKIMDNKNCAIKNLTQANMKIDKEINEAQLEYKIIMNKISNFELKYDENHIALNGDEQRELFDKSHKLIDKITDLKEAKTKCEEYLVELKQPSKEVETINSILNGTYDSKLRKATEKDLEVEDKKDNTEKEETKVGKEEKENVNSTKIEPVKTEATKVDKIDLNDIDFTLPKEEQKKSYEEKTKSTEKKKIEDVKAVYINGKKSEIYINKDKENPIKIEYSDDKDITINKIVKDAFNVVPKGIKKLEESLKNPDTSEEDKIINEQLLKTYKEQQEQLNSKTEGKYIEFQYADPNIVTLLKNNPEQLQEYADFLNGKKKIDKEHKMSFDIKYDIRGLSKSEMSDEEKQQIEDYAFIHRNIAKVKKTPFQAIKFAFKGLLEKFRKVKALPAGDLIKDDDDYTMSDECKEAYEKAYEQKSFKESLKVKETEEKTNDNIDEKMNRYEELAKKINESFDKDI